jgi:type IV secretion system protein VirB6
VSGQCAPLVENASDGVLAALRAVDCLSNEMTATAFGRLFGGQGALLPALTILLTLYIAFFAISLLTGRSRIGISALTPRFITLGLVLTFATSWVAYQNVVWAIALGAPDQIAAIISGTQGSATEIFASRIDLVFQLVTQAADATSAGPEGAASAAASGSFTPGNLMWLGALLLMLGTIGVLVTARIALAILLAVGPVFVVLALFGPTKGLCAGWLRGVVIMAVTPLFVVVGGGLMLELLIPVLRTLVDAEGINGRAALALFMIASIHMALMILVIKVTAAMVAAWNAFGLAAPQAGEGSSASRSLPFNDAAPLMSSAATGSMSYGSRRISTVVGLEPASASAGAPLAGAASAPQRMIVQATVESSSQPRGGPAARARGIGSQFRKPGAARKER